MTSLWVAWAELWARKRYFVASAALVAAAVALFSATELISRAREAAVASQIDYLGPTLRLVAAGVSSSELARFELGDKLIPVRTVWQLRSALSDWLRASEGRLLVMDTVDTVKSPIIGMAPDGGFGALAAVQNLGASEVLLGADLARRLRKTVGQRVSFLGRRWQVQAILPPLGGAEDLAVIVNLSALQKVRGVGANVNEIRLYATPGAEIAEASAILRSTYPDLNILQGADRGDPAEGQTIATLQRHRAVAYSLTALAVAIGLMIAAYLNAAERRVEMALVVAMGGTNLSALAILVARAALIGVVGALAGYVLGAAVAVAQDPGAGLSMAWSWTQPAAAMMTATILSMAASVPVSVQVSWQDHVRFLQE